MKRNLVLACAAATAVLAAPANAEKFNANKILFDDVTASVEITTATGPAIDVAVRQGKDYHKIDVSLQNGVVVVKGEPWKDEEPYDCCNTRIRRTFDARHDRQPGTGPGVDEGLFAAYPTIVVSVPAASNVSFVDARMKLKMATITGALNLDACYVYGEAGGAGEAVVGMLSGSRLVMGDVGSGLEVDLSGDADFKAGRAATVDVDIAGPGDVILGDIDGMLDVSIAGSGTVRNTRLEGPLTARIAGSGAVLVGAGRADKLRATIDGSGTVLVSGVAVDPDLRLYGSAEVRLGAVRGRINHQGSGEVYVADKLVPKDAAR